MTTTSDLEAARLASGAPTVVAYIADPAAPSGGTGSCTWAEVVAPGGHSALVTDATDVRVTVNGGDLHEDRCA